MATTENIQNEAALWMCPVCEELYNTSFSVDGEVCKLSVRSCFVSGPGTHLTNTYRLLKPTHICCQCSSSCAFANCLSDGSWFGQARKGSSWFGFNLRAIDGNLSDQDVVCVRRRDGHSWWIQAGIIGCRRLPRDLVRLAVIVAEALCLFEREGCVTDCCSRLAKSRSGRVEMHEL